MAEIGTVILAPFRERVDISLWPGRSRYGIAIHGTHRHIWTNCPVLIFYYFFILSCDSFIGVKNFLSATTRIKLLACSTIKFIINICILLMFWGICSVLHQFFGVCHLTLIGSPKSIIHCLFLRFISFQGIVHNIGHIATLPSILGKSLSVLPKILNGIPLIKR